MEVGPKSQAGVHSQMEKSLQDGVLILIFGKGEQRYQLNIHYTG